MPFRFVLIFLVLMTLPGLAGPREAWTTSRIVGSPEPPPPYRAEIAFPHLEFHEPLHLAAIPGSDRLVVSERNGRIVSFPNRPDVRQTDLFVNLAELKPLNHPTATGVQAVYSLTFHPDFVHNRTCYVCYILRSPKGAGPLQDGTRISRFRVTDTDPPRLDTTTETVLITWLAGGHNGCSLNFGPDGMLYISTGDAEVPNPPDPLDTGQDISDLLSSILRIDVDRPSEGRPYSIPKDNPFVDHPGARPEVWAYGLRNPWRMSFDPDTGDLWVGDVGWELWEMVYRVEKGGNYGWPIMEGPQPVKPDGKRGPTPILPPTLKYPHTEGASVTGGYVYRGEHLPDLRGTYIYGDYVSRKIWAARFDGDTLVENTEIARTPVQIVSFGLDADGELYFLDFAKPGQIYRLAPNPPDPNRPEFPQRLSQTGLFTDLTTMQTALGVTRFDINAHHWMDHATAVHHVALPGTEPVRFHHGKQAMPDSRHRSRIWFPKNGVLAKTISLRMDERDPNSARPIETQILHFDGNDWNGYTYRWNDTGTDAELVPSDGAETTFRVTDPREPGGVREQTWRFHSRGECMRCHNPWADTALAFTPAQLQRADQLDHLEQRGIVDVAEPVREHLAAFADPLDASAPLADRARTYLHVNCAHCHQDGAGGTATIDLRFDRSLEQTKTIGARPVQGTFDIPEAEIIAAGNPYRSTLYYRLCKLGNGRMPHVGSECVDVSGKDMIREWILSLGDDSAEGSLPDVPKSVEQRTAWIARMTTEPGSALRLADAFDRLPAPVRAEVLTTTRDHPNAGVRDLFQRFLPADQRRRTLGTRIDPLSILRLSGDAQNGERILRDVNRSQCLNCHQLGDQGKDFAPELTKIATRLTRGEILESLLDPWKDVDPKYKSYRVETLDGRVATGLIVRRGEDRIDLRDATGKLLSFANQDIDTLTALPTSLMPEGLLRDMTGQEAADLIEFLATRK